MKAFIICDRAGRITCVAVPGPDLVDFLDLEISPDRDLLEVDLNCVLRMNGDTFGQSIDEGLPLEDAVAELAVKHYVDLYERQLRRINA